MFFFPPRHVDKSLQNLPVKRWASQSCALANHSIFVGLSFLKRTNEGKLTFHGRRTARPSGSGGVGWVGIPTPRGGGDSLEERGTSRGTLARRDSNPQLAPDPPFVLPTSALSRPPPSASNPSTFPDSLVPLPSPIPPLAQLRAPAGPLIKCRAGGGGGSQLTPSRRVLKGFPALRKGSADAAQLLSAPDSGPWDNPFDGRVIRGPGASCKPPQVSIPCLSIALGQVESSGEDPDTALIPAWLPLPSTHRPLPWWGWAN